MNKKAMLLVMSVVSLGMLTGCGGSKDSNINDTTDKEVVEKVDKVDTDKEVEKGESVEKIINPKGVEVAQDHFEYFMSHQDRLMDGLEDLYNELRVDSDNPDNMEYTPEAEAKLKDVVTLADEYSEYKNKIKETSDADKIYKKAVVEFKAFMSISEKNFKEGIFDQHEEADKHIMAFLDHSSEAFSKFQDLDINTDI